MMDLTMESFNVRCCECGERITIFKSDLDIEESCYDHGDNCMGIEIIYEIQHEISCPKCGNDIEITSNTIKYLADKDDCSDQSRIQAQNIRVEECQKR